MLPVLGAAPVAQVAGMVQVGAALTHIVWAVYGIRRRYVPVVVFKSAMHVEVYIAYGVLRSCSPCCGHCRQGAYDVLHKNVF